MAWGGGRTYKHGVMVGNWHEEEAGLRLAAQPASNYNPKTHFLTETAAHFRPPGPETLIDNYYTKLNARPLGSVNGSQLFRHAGADSYETRYLTTYSTANHAVGLHAVRQRDARAQSAVGSARSGVSFADSAAGAGAGAAAASASLRASVSAGGPRSPSRLQALQQTQQSPQSARSPPRDAAAAAGAAEPALEGVAAARAPQAAAATAGDVKIASPSQGAGHGHVAKPNIFHTVRGPYHQQFSAAKPQVPQAAAAVSGAAESGRFAATRPGAKAGKPRGTGAAIPRVEVNPTNARAGDLSIEYAAFTLGGRKKPFPVVPDPSLALDRFAAKIDGWRNEREGSLRTRSYESEHAGSFAHPMAAAHKQQLTASSGGAAAAALGVAGNPFATSVAATGAAAGAKTSQFARDAQGNPRTHFRKHQQFKVAHDWGALRLRA